MALLDLEEMGILAVLEERVQMEVKGMELGVGIHFLGFQIMDQMEIKVKQVVEVEVEVLEVEKIVRVLEFVYFVEQDVAVEVAAVAVVEEMVLKEVKVVVLRLQF